MSDTNKSRNTAIACGNMKEENGRIIIEEGKYGPSKQDLLDLAGMEITCDTHTFEQAQNGEVVRVNQNGEKLPGKVTNPKVIKAVRAMQDRGAAR